MKRFIKSLPGSVPLAVKGRLYLQASIFALFFFCMVFVFIWTGNTLTMITAIARFERTHTASRLEAKAALLTYLDTRENSFRKSFYKNMAVTQSYNNVFGNLLTMRKTLNKKEFVRILENTFKETDYKTSVIIVNRIKLLYWHPIIIELVDYARKANRSGEDIIEAATHAMRTENKERQLPDLQKIRIAEENFVFYEKSFSRRCSDLANEIAMFVNYFSIVMLIFSIGFTSLITYLLARVLLQQAAIYTRDLEESQERLNLVIKGSNDAPWDLDLIHDKIFYSPQWWAQLGYEPDELTSDTTLWKKLMHPEDADHVDSIFKDALKSGIDSYNTEFRLLHKKGHYVPVLSRGFITRDTDGNPVRVTGTNMDLTERRAAEEALRKKSEFLDKVIESAALSTWISDEKGTVIRTNPACLEFFGATEDEVIGKYNLLQDAVIEKNGFMPDIREVFEKGKAADIVIDYDFRAVGHVNAKNATNKTINSIFTPIKDSSGKVTNVIVQSIDLTKIKEMEKELIQSRKMESIGILAGGVAHDFNNILSIILGNTELALDKSDDLNPLYNHLKEIKTASLRAKDVVRQLLSFSRKTEQEQKPVEIKKVIKESIQLIRSSIPSSVEIHENMPEKNHIILADATQIHQIIINLCTNAAHAMSENGGVLEIILRSRTLDEKTDEIFNGLAPGKYIELIVRDSGSGIDPEIHDKIFDPYFTTKEIGKGTGMGLAVVHGIVENHNGAISVDTEPGKGTTFTIVFPIITDKYQHNTQVITIKSNPSGKESILFVDDEKALADMAKMVLEKFGYMVQISTNPIQALAQFKADPTFFDLVITDMTMPQMTGVQLSEKLRQIQNDIPIIICTGHSSLINEEKAKKMGVSAFAMKPITMSEIAKLIRTVLDK